MSNSDKQYLLDVLKSEMEKDETLPLKKGATRLVFGAGNPESKILLIGEGPGYWEDQKGEPFVGNAGKLLDRLLSSIGLKRTDVYITNVVHHRPPENRDPEPFEIEAYGKYLDKIIEIIEPQIIFTLGRFSMAKFLPSAKISSVHGKEQKVFWNGKELLIVPMYHPAASLRNGNIMQQEVSDFLRIGEVLNGLEETEKKEKLDKKLKGEQMNLV